MEGNNSGLTMEQEFRMIALEEAISRMTLEEAREYVRELTRQAMLKENIVKAWMRQDLAGEVS